MLNEPCKNTTEAPKEYIFLFVQVVFYTGIIFVFATIVSTAPPYKLVDFNE